MKQMLNLCWIEHENPKGTLVIASELYKKRKENQEGRFPCVDRTFKMVADNFTILLLQV